MEILILMVTNVKQIVKKNLIVLVNVAAVLKKMTAEYVVVIILPVPIVIVW